MSVWTSDELSRVGKADELQISPLRKDGILRKPVIIWVVRVGDDLYVRSVKGRSSAWFQGVQSLHEGQIRAGGVVKDVIFAEASDPTINDQIDTAYATKYRRYPSILPSINSPTARAASIKLIPHTPSA